MALRHLEDPPQEQGEERADECHHRLSRHAAFGRDARGAECDAGDERAAYGECDVAANAEIVALQELTGDRAYAEADHHEPDVLHWTLPGGSGAYALLRPE